MLSAHQRTRPSGLRAQGFVELPPPTLSLLGGSACQVEFADERGGQMTVHLPTRRAGPVGAGPSLLESSPMIQITPQMRILLAVEPADFRKGIDGLVGLCRQTLGTNPLEGALFVFRN